MANFIFVPKRKLLTARPGETEVSEPGVSINNVTNTTNVTVGGNYLPLAGGTLWGTLHSPVGLRIPVGTDMY